ncbi:MAG: winged helix-turn-helix transcriptional regulator [Candidatus Hydrothermarchaeaceae archaeon]
MKNEGLCPVVTTAKIIGKRWALIIRHNLLDNPLGFNELKRRVDGISSKTLSTSLSYLVEKGIVARSVHTNSPIRVEYSLTQKGMDLKPLIEDMRYWGEKWLLAAE